MLLDPWRQISAGPDPPRIIHAVIEMTKGSQNKYEYNILIGGFTLDRVLYTFFPCDYGFVPQTLDEDGDPLDVILLINQPTFTGCIITARPVGVMKMLDEGKEDHKIIAVSTTDPHFRQIVDVEDISDALITALTYFFNHYKEAEGKETRVLEWKSASEAKELIKTAMNLYNRKMREEVKIA